MRITIMILVMLVSSQTVWATGIGFQFVKFSDPLQGAIFYPSSQKITQPTVLGDYFLIQAEQNAKIKQSRYPLIVISHGHASSRLNHHDTAVYLAQQGFIVAAIEHDGDNYHDQSASGTKEYWANRPKQISILIDRLQNDPYWQNFIHNDQIGFIGYSAGSFTGLSLAGARSDFNLFDQYCQQTDLDLPYCKFRLPKGLVDYMQQQDLSDNRIKSYFLLAPVALMFDDLNLANIKAPVYLISAENDQAVESTANVERLAKQLTNLVGWDVIPDAGHFVFLSPCSERFKREAAIFCRDSDGVDRVTIHNKFNQQAARFFLSQLIEKQ